MIIDQTLRLVAVACLVISSLCIIAGNGSFCLYEYAGQDTIWRLDELTGGISKDPDMFRISGIFSIIVFIPLLLAYHRAWYFVCFVILILIQFILLKVMIDSASVFGLVYDSIVYCQNYGLFVWAIGELLFIILSLVFIFHEFKY